MDKIKIGIVGLGWVSQGHMHAFKEHPEVEVTAVCSRRNWEREALEAQYGAGVRFYQNYAEMLHDPEVEVVDICSEHRLHVDQAILAAEHGKHVMIEKPISLDYADLKRLYAVMEKTGVKSTVYFELRFIPHFNLIQSLLKQGMLGELHYLEVDYYHGIGPWYGQYAWNVKKSEGGSSLLTAGIHALDALLYFKGSDVEEVQAYSVKSRADVFQEYEYDTSSIALIRFKDGSVGKCASCIDARQPYLFNIHLLGSEGTVWNNKVSSTRLEGVTPGAWIDIPTMQAESGDVLAHPYGPQIDHFVQCLKEGRDSSINFAAAYKTHQVAFAIEKSLAERRAVKLSEL